MIQVIVLLVDALRLDFISPSHTWKESAGGEEAGHYRSRMPFVHQLLDAADGNTVLLPFLADPPTVTFQRLKGLTTGSMPTFFDVSSSFASPAITEDNWIMQFRRTGRCGSFSVAPTVLGL